MTPPRNLASIDHIRRLLHPERHASRARTAEGLPGHDIRVDGRPVHVYATGAVTHAELEARIRAALAAPRPAVEGLRGMPSDTQRRARTLANLDLIAGSAR